MRKHLLLTAALLFVFNAAIHAQSVKFSDLVYYTNINSKQVSNTLMASNLFAKENIDVVNGQVIDHFTKIGKNANSEKIEVGNFIKLNDGTLLRSVNYSSTDSKNIINMISQAKNYGLVLKFRGADRSNNIYLYDNDFYHVSIYLRRDQSSGLVEIKQKENVGLE